MEELICVDLFSGAGGLSKGFLDAGYNVVLGVDHDEAALKTFELNHGDAVAMDLDLFNHDNIDEIVSFLATSKWHPKIKFSDNFGCKPGATY